MKKIFLVGAFYCLTLSIYGQNEIKAAFYNLLNYPEETRPPNRLQYLNIILEDMAPDIFMACELNSEDGAREILSVLRNTVKSSYQMAPFVLNTSDNAIGDENELQNIMYYDTDLFVLDAQSTITTSYRDFNRYRLKLKSAVEANAVYLEVIVCHLKSQDGSANENLRLEMVNDLEDFLDTLPPESFVILGGDLNVYKSTEPAFTELLNTVNQITFVDPAGRLGNWHNNSSFLDVFTQSTRQYSGLGGASGGFDDRFDFILTSESLTTGSTLSYVEESYEAYGNNINADCYNSAINSSDCSGPDYTFEIRDALFNFSDHLPVTLRIRTDLTLSNPYDDRSASIQITGSNMVKNILRIKIDHTQRSSQSLKIYNSYGQLIASLKVNNSVYINQNTSNWTSGVYYLIGDAQNTEPIKFIISD